MADYQHILLAVDFSDEDTYVARKAERLATFFNAKLSVIHILDNIPMPDTAYGTEIPLYSDSPYERLEIEKNKLIHTANQLTIDPTNLWLIWGKPEVEIIRIANREDIDLIVVGSHGRHGLALLLGSTASGVLHHAQCDVLAVRLQDEWTESTIFAYS
ncbi:universal stress protein [Nitrosomonas sp. Nm34]|uniref:universal stress protein n=1 Tax=Nitrosomonas sp. Nm34 TaxID=1881055 RepID=UPI0008E45F80|nr:universal stress protein [Nitrosomonas sp. Nm34]SFI69327.1 universal stress protein A [Nitrosomonas sp. Nm34]